MVSAVHKVKKSPKRLSDWTTTTNAFLSLSDFMKFLQNFCLVFPSKQIPSARVGTWISPIPMWKTHWNVSLGAGASRWREYVWLAFSPGSFRALSLAARSMGWSRTSTPQWLFMCVPYAECECVSPLGAARGKGIRTSFIDLEGENTESAPTGDG